MLKKFLSRKFITVILTTIVTPFLASHGVPEPVVAWLLGTISAYLIGQSAVDAVSVKVSKKKA